MTLRRFLKELKDSGIKFFLKRGRVRTVTGRCPIEALGEHVKGKRQGLLRASITLGLEEDVARKIASAADNIHMPIDDGPKIRRALERLCE